MYILKERSNYPSGSRFDTMVMINGGAIMEKNKPQYKYKTLVYCPPRFKINFAFEFFFSIGNALPWRVGEVK